MSDSKCTICSSEVSAKGCLCDGSIKLIGAQCLLDHIGDASVDHNLVDINLALRMGSDKSLIDFYLSELPRIHDALNYLRSNSTRIKEFKRDHLKDKQNLICKIEEIFSQKGTPIDEKDSEINSKIRLISIYKDTLCDEGRELMETYRAQGLDGLLSNNLQRIEIPIDEIQYYISNSIQAYYTSDNIKPETKGYVLPYKQRQTELDIKDISDEQSCMREDIEGSNSSVIQILDKDALIQELESEVNMQDVKIRSLNDQIETHKRTIRELIQKCEEKDEELNDQMTSSEDKDHEIEKLRLKLLENDYKIDEFKRNEEKIQSSLGHISTFVERMTSQLNELKDIQKLIRSDLETLKDVKLNWTKSKLISAIREFEGNIDKHLVMSMEGLSKFEDIKVNLEGYLNTEMAKLYASKRYIYSPIQNKKQMLKFDIHTGKVHIIDMPILNRTFSDTSSCELPNGDLFLSGFNNQLSNEVYLYKAASEECIALPPLANPICFVSLYYYRDYVYAFGGLNSNKAQRYSLSNSSWETLPDMKYKRSCVSCVGIDDEIYLFYGGSDSIEVFNTNTLEFNEIEFDNSDSDASDYGIAFRVDDRVYLLTDTLTQLYDTSLNKISQYTNTYKMNHFSINNTVQYTNCIYYYNYHSLNMRR